MSWFNRYVVGAFSPRRALMRERYAKGLRAYYEAAEPSRMRKTRTDRRSANALNERAIVPIRTTARHLDENYDIASGILDVLVANSVGTGIQPEPQVMLRSGEPAEEVNRRLLQIFEDWRFFPEVTGQHDYYGLQGLTARSWFRDGECFTQRITGTVPGLDHGTIVPYSLEALEADFVPVDYSDSALGITQGVELSAWGRPRAYHVYKNHPGDGIIVTSERKRVTADRMMHLAFRKRLHQVRGMSVFATIINRLEDIKGVDEDERLAARVAAAMAAVIKKGSPDGYEAPDELGADGLPVQRQMQFEGGIIFDDLRPGESVETIDTKRPNNALIPFRDAQLKAIAAGAGSSYSSISKNYDGTYSAQRQELVEHYMLYQMLASPFVYRYCQPVWDGLVDASLASGALTLPADVNRETLYDCTHTGPAMPWVDPEKEVNAQILAMQWRLTSRSSVIRARGDNPDQVNREIVRDEAEMERLGIEFMEDAAALERGTESEAPRKRKGVDALAHRPRLLNAARSSVRA